MGSVQLSVYTHSFRRRDESIIVGGWHKQRWVDRRRVGRFLSTVAVGDNNPSLRIKKKDNVEL